MRTFSAYVVFLSLSTLAADLNPLLAQQRHDSSTGNVAGEWLFTIDYFGNPLEQTIVFTKEKSAVSAHYMGDTTKLIVEQNGNSFKITSKQSDGSFTAYEGVLQLNDGAGIVKMYDPLIRDTTINEWKSVKVDGNVARTPHVVNFKPVAFQRAFSGTVKPVLHVSPMDTVNTESVDAAGIDKTGKTRVMGGNPLTGPFYVETALPGDVLAVNIIHLKLNRSWAISSKGIVDRALTNFYVQNHKVSFDGVRWNIDLQKGRAYPEKPDEHMKQYSIAVKPMLGCVGVAPWPGSQPISTGDSGPFGGNMDFNQVVEGATVYLPVFRPGALLYLGDAHAVQGDGELTGDALETSMDIEFSVRVIKDTSIHLGSPRIENSEAIMAMGLSGSLDDAIRRATSELAAWLEQSYRLSPPEISQVLGTAIIYHISEVADRNVGVVAELKKTTLAGLNK